MCYFFCSPSFGSPGAAAGCEFGAFFALSSVFIGAVTSGGSAIFDPARAGGFSGGKLGGPAAAAGCGPRAAEALSGLSEHPSPKIYSFFVSVDFDGI